MKGLLLSPAFVWIGFLVLAPNIFLILYSLWENDFGTVVQTFSFGEVVLPCCLAQVRMCWPPAGSGRGWRSPSTGPTTGGSPSCG